MTTKLAGALLSSARAARGLLKPALLLTNDPDNGNATVATVLSYEVKARIEVVINKMLEYHCTHWLPNMARNYAPKQQE